MNTVAYRIGEMLGTQVAVLFFGFIVMYILHVLFDLSANDAAANVVAVQMFAAGWVIRGWFNKTGKEE